MLFFTGPLFNMKRSYFLGSNNLFSKIAQFEFESHADTVSKNECRTPRNKCHGNFGILRKDIIPKNRSHALGPVPCF